jgi:hypothetical protein
VSRGGGQVCRGGGQVSRGSVRASRAYDGDCRRYVELLRSGQAELSRTIGRPELEDMGATTAPPPSPEELGIGGNGEVGYDVGWGWTLE